MYQNREPGGVEPGTAGAATLILRHANIATMNPRQPEAQAVAIRDGRIAAVGDDGEADSWAGAGTVVRDLRGRTLLPGFFDSHNHMLMTALNLKAVDLSTATSVGHVVQAIGERVAVSPPGAWITSSARWHESQLVERRFPRREELDAVAPNHPVLLRRGGHNVVVNSAAIRLAGIDRGTPNPPGGTYVRDPESSELTGHAIGASAFAPILRAMPTPPIENQMEALREVMRLYNAAGITSVIDPALTLDEMEAYRVLAKNRELTVRTSMLWACDLDTTDATLRTALRELESGRVERSLEDPWLRTLALKLVVDGGVETGYWRDPYAYADDPASPRGKPRLTRENMVAFCTEAARRGWQVGAHCVGDAAIDMVLGAFAEVNEVTPITQLRWTLIHMMAARPEHFAPLNELRLAITTHQPLQYSLAAGFLRYVGPERTRDIEPLRLYLDRCLQPVGGGSDSPVTPYPPLLGIWSSVTRETAQAGVQGPEWAITPAEALRMYTAGSAWCAFEEGVKGTIEPGRYADLVVLSADPCEVDSAAIREIQVEATMVDGRMVFDREPGA